MLGAAAAAAAAWSAWADAQAAVTPVVPSGESSTEDIASYDDLYVPTFDESEYCIFAGSGNKELAAEVATLLGCQLGRAKVSQFADGESNIQFKDSVRGKHVFVIQPTSYPPNDNLIELLLMISTLRRASAETVTAIVPYFGYSRQLTPVGKNGDPVSLAAADVAVMMRVAGVDQVVALDLHKSQIEGFFDTKIPVENLDTTRSAIPYLLRKDLHRPVCVSMGRAKKTKYVRDLLTKAGIKDSEMGFIFFKGKKGVEDVNEETHPDKEDIGALKQHRVEFVGDVKGRDVIICTDMIDTGSRVSSSADCLQRLGARRIMALTTHGLLTDNAIEGIEASALDEVVMFNTIPLNNDSEKIRLLSASRLIAQAISRIHENRSVGGLY